MLVRRRQAESDIIPQIQILIQRFLTGDFPYQLIRHEEWAFGHSLYPTYLPLTWMPFILAEQVGLDYRWFAYLCLLGGVGYLLTFFRQLPLLKYLALAMGPFLILVFNFYEKPEELSLSVETFITAYYLCLAISLLTTSTISRGLFLLCCLLSRYSIVLWVPLFFLVLWKKEKRRNSLWIGAIIFGGFLIFYFPFLLEDFSIFQQGYDYHSKAAVNLWKPRAWQAAGATPINLLQGVGFGCYFYEYLDMDLIGKLKAYRLTHLILSLSTVALLAVYFFKRHLRIDYRLFLLGSLKIYLVVFYNFIQIPFMYLYLVPAFVSLPLIGVVLSKYSVENV